MTAIEFFIEYYGMSENEVSEGSRQFLTELETALTSQVVKHKDEMIHITMSPARWKEFVEYLKTKHK